MNEHMHYKVSFAPDILFLFGLNLLVFVPLVALDHYYTWEKYKVVNIHSNNKKKHKHKHKQKHQSKRQAPPSYYAYSAASSSSSFSTLYRSLNLQRHRFFVILSALIVVAFVLTEYYTPNPSHRERPNVKSKSDTQSVILTVTLIPQQFKKFAMTYTWVPYWIPFLLGVLYGKCFLSITESSSCMRELGYACVCMYSYHL